jgi:plastocyanin
MNTLTSPSNAITPSVAPFTSVKLTVNVNEKGAFSPDFITIVVGETVSI